MYNYFNVLDFEEKLVSSIKKSDKVIIVPHVHPDFDCIGSAIGLASICEHFGGKPYILIDEKESDLDFKIAEMIKNSKEDYNIINLDDYLNMAGDNDLLITTDVNKANIVHVERYLNNFKDIFIVDHHDIDENTIKTSFSNMYINPYSSSACEMVTGLIEDFGVDIDSKVATYLYSGIVLDTNRFMKATTSNTFVVASELLKKGASIDRVNYLLKNNNIQNLKIYKLINTCRFYNYNLGLAGFAREDTQVYEPKEIAIAADKILDGELAYNDSFKNLSIENLNVSFAMGPIDRKNYRISCRSLEGTVDVSDIMEKLGGGGNKISGASEIPASSVGKALVKLKDIIKRY